MIYLNKKDEELVRTLSLMKQFSAKQEKILGELRNRYESNPEDPNAAISYAIFIFLTIKRFMNEADVALKNVSIVLEALERALTVHPDFWLARLFKCILNSSFPSSVRNDDVYEEDLTLWVQQQEEAEAKSYFAIPYIMLADFYFMARNKEKAVEMIEKAKSFASLGEVALLQDFVCIPVKNFLERLIQSRERELVEVMRHLWNALFPNNKAI